MKKLLLFVLFAASFSLSAQTTQKTVRIPLDKYDTFKKIQSVNSFKHFYNVPENVTDVYSGSDFLYTTAETPQYLLKIMADGEWQFAFKNQKQTFYFRFPNNVLVGYSLTVSADGDVRMFMYEKNKFVHDDNIKQSK